MVGQVGVMNSQKKFNLDFTTKPDGTEWVRLSFFDGYHQNWIPSLPELAEIIRPIAKIEALKYPKGKGADFVRQFFYDVCLTNIPIEEIYEKYQFKPKKTRQNFAKQLSF